METPDGIWFSHNDDSSFKPQDLLSNGQVMSRNEGLDDGYEERGRISWKKDPNRDLRLMDWLDQHPLQREIIFSNPGRGRGRGSRKPGAKMSKIQCCMQAAKDIFSVDTDPSIRQDVVKDPQHFAGATYSHILHMKTTYQQFNEEPGPHYANIPYTDLEVGSEGYKKVDELLEWFPLWKRLHVHWRRIPAFNHLYGQHSADSSQSSTQHPAEPNGGHVNRSQVVGLQESLENVVSNGTPGGQHRGDAIIVEDLEGTIFSQNDVAVKPEEEVADNCTRRKRQRKRRREQELEEEPAPSDNSARQNDDMVAIREHERSLTELAVKRQKLENEALEKKTAIETRRLELESEERRRAAEDKRQREKEQHEFMMRLMEMATGMVKKPNQDTEGEGS
ncbi:unnamed protein product [Cyclocybe aegerita]|uniref:No apical meristem-associated C-terminal domain-containing protein n=1 Tax=Cyclocybe aegerita TaxID=1973307 RepID=A0A8S0XML6_CYCAE|nr:unnamed protein product [Cyclocybe aegerita]